MKRILYVVLAALLAALPAQSQVPPGEGIVINQTPIQGGSADQCLYKTTAGKVGAQACGTGTAADITVGTTTVTGAASGDLLTRGASALGKLTPGTGVNTALAVNVGTAGSFVTNGGDLGTPSSGTLTGLVTGSVAWASLPAAGTAGRFYRVSDVGTKGSLWMDDGARWKPFNGAAMLASLDTASAGINAGATIVFQYQLPANVWKVGDRLRIFANLQKSGTTNTGFVTVYIGTAGTTGDAAVLTCTCLAAGSRTGAFIWDIRLEDATHSQTMSGPLTGYGQNSTQALQAQSTISNVSNALWVSVAINGGASDTAAVTDSQLYYVASAN